MEISGREAGIRLPPSGAKLAQTPVGARVNSIRERSEHLLLGLSPTDLIFMTGYFCLQKRYSPDKFSVHLFPANLGGNHNHIFRIHPYHGFSVILVITGL